MHSAEGKPNPKQQCDICQGWYGNLKAHRARHISEPQICTICDKEYPNKQALIQHTQFVHSDSMYECNMCDKKFKMKSSLKVSILTTFIVKMF